MPHALPLQTSHIQEGTYVVFELDTITTMWHLGPAAQARAAKLPTRKYVALVGQVSECDRWGEPHRQCVLHLVGAGMPTPHPYHVTDAAMSVPLSPAAAHPATRAPLVPAPPLPAAWPACYQHTLLAPTVYVKDVHPGAGAGAAARLPRKDVLRHYACARADRLREAALFEAEVAKLAGAHAGSDDEFSPDRAGAQDEGAWDSHVQAAVTVDVWLDLSAVSAPPDPRGLFEELGALLRIEEQSSRPKGGKTQEILYLAPEAS